MPEWYGEGITLARLDRDGARERFERVFTAGGIDLARDVDPCSLAEEAHPAAVHALAQWAGLNNWDRLDESTAAHRLLLSLPPETRGERAYRLRHGLGCDLWSLGQLEEALLEFTRVARLHHVSRSYQNAAIRMAARTLHDLGRYEEALRWIEAYGGPAGDPRVTYLKGLTLLRLSRKAEGLRVLRRLAAGEEREELVRLAREKIAKMESENLTGAHEVSKR